MSRKYFSNNVKLRIVQRMCRLIKLICIDKVSCTALQRKPGVDTVRAFILIVTQGICNVLKCVLLSDNVLIFTDGSVLGPLRHESAATTAAGDRANSSDRC